MKQIQYLRAAGLRRQSDSQCAPLMTAAVLIAATAAVILAPQQAPAQPPSPEVVQPATRLESTLANSTVHDELLRHGNVNQLFDALSAADQTDPRQLRDVITVARERGNLSEALRALRLLANAVPNDAGLLEELAIAQDQCGLVSDSMATLREAIAVAPDPRRRAALTLRCAMLMNESGSPDETRRLLDAAVADDPESAVRVGVLAYLCGLYDVSSHYLGLDSGHHPVALKLLQGNAAFHTGDYAQATAAFNAAFIGTARSQDRRYSQERLIASARDAGRLGALADEWVGEANPPTERPLALAVVLRELGRTHELIAWWRARLTRPDVPDVLLSRRFVDELVGAAQEAGFDADAEAVGRDLLARTPDDPVALALVLRIFLNEGKQSEADAILKQRIDAALNDASRLSTLGKMAKSLYRDRMAYAAATALQALGGNHAVTGLLLESSVLLRAGDRGQATDRLEMAATLAKAQPALLGEVATAFESAHQEPEAIRLLQLEIKTAPDDAKQERLAALLMQQRRYDEAITILQTLRHAGNTEGLRTQSAQRLLDSAAANRSLPTLISVTQRLVDSGTADASDVSLLVDAYLRVQNIDAAAGLLKATPLLNATDRLARLAVLYIRSHRLEEASRVLQELVVAAPQNATTTLEQLAAVELDRKQPQAAADAISEIGRRANKEGSTLELMGGVYDRLGQAAQAATCYRKAVAARPENVDNWLLWATASAKAGNAAEAIQRLQVLCQDADNSDVFALAVDGMLNLKASPPALRAARHEAILRLAARPQDAMLYHIVGDLSEELGDPATYLASIDASLSAIVEERPDHLRQLMEVAMNKGRADDASACGRSILAIGDDFPPQLFMQLGEQLLIAGRANDAASAFARAQEVSSDEVVVPRVSDLFEKYGQPARALQLMSKLAGKQTSDAAFPSKMARLYELTGNTPAAFDQYMRAINLIAAELAVPPDTDVISSQRSEVSPADLTQLGDGAIATARRPEQQNTLIRDLRALVDHLCGQHNDGGQPPRGLIQLSSLLRRSCLVFGKIDEADRLDRQLIEQWPNVASIAGAAIDQRLSQGLFTAATQCAGSARVQELLPVSLRYFGSGGLPATMPSTRPTAIDAITAASLLPGLIASGRDDEARAMLDSVPMEIPLRRPELVIELVGAATLLGENRLAEDWAVFWLKATTLSNGRKTPLTPPARVLSSVYRVLGADGERRLAQQVVAMSQAETPSAGSDGFSAVALQLAGAGKIELENGVEKALQLASRPTAIGNLSLAGSSGVASLIHLLPVGDRPEFVKRLIDQCRPNERLQMIQWIVAQAVEPFDDRTNAALIAAADGVGIAQVLTPSPWFANPSHASVLPAIAHAVLRSADASGVGQIDALLSSASALADANPVEAEQIALRTIELIRRPMAPRGTTTGNPSGVDRIDAFRRALSVLTSDARARVLDSLTSTAETKDSPAWPWTMKAVTLESLGRRDEALAAIRAAAKADPKDVGSQKAYLNRLAVDGRAAETVDAFGTRQTVLDGSIRKAVNRAAVQLFRSREAMLAPAVVGASYVPEQLPIDFMTPLANGDLPKLSERLRVLLERQRVARAGLPVIASADAEGLTGDDNETGKIVSASELWHGSSADLAAALRTAQPGGAYAKWLSERFVDAITVNGRPSATTDAALAEFEKRSGAMALISNDRLVLQRLALIPGVKLVPSLLNELFMGCINDPIRGDYDALLRSLDALNDPRATGVRRWLSVFQRPNESGGGVTQSNNQHERRPSPVDRVDDGSTAEWLASLLDSGQKDRAESELKNLRQSGRVSMNHFRCGLIWVRIAAERGDVTEFSKRLDTVLATRTWMAGAMNGATDILRALPNTPTTAASEDVITPAAVKCVQKAAARWPGDTDWTRALATIGNGSAKRGNTIAAGLALDAAQTLADEQGSGEHQLWVADLADRLGRTDLSWRIQKRLLSERCLPAIRIAKLLKHMSETGDGDSAKKFATDAARYCQEPTLQAMAHTIGR